MVCLHDFFFQTEKNSMVKGETPLITVKTTLSEYNICQIYIQTLWTSKPLHVHLCVVFLHPLIKEPGKAELCERLLEALDAGNWSDVTLIFSCHSPLSIHGSMVYLQLWLVGLENKKIRREHLKKKLNIKQCRARWNCSIHPMQ